MRLRTWLKDVSNASFEWMCLSYWSNRTSMRSKLNYLVLTSAAGSTPPPPASSSACAVESGGFFQRVLPQKLPKTSPIECPAVHITLWGAQQTQDAVKIRLKRRWRWVGKFPARGHSNTRLELASFSTEISKHFKKTIHNEKVQTSDISLLLTVKNQVAASLSLPPGKYPPTSVCKPRLYTHLRLDFPLSTSGSLPAVVR